MACFDLELDMIDGLSVDSGGVGSLREIVNTSPNPLQSNPGARKIILNGDTTDMVGAIITTFDGTQSYVTGLYSEVINATDYDFVYTAPVLSTNANLTNPDIDTKMLWLTTQSADDYQINGVDNKQIFRAYTFPKDLPLDYQPEINYLDERLDVIEDTPDGAAWGSVYRLGTDALLLNGDTTTKCSVKKGSATITGTYSSSADKTTYPLNLGDDPFHIDTTTLQVFNGTDGGSLPYMVFYLPGDLPLNYQPQIDDLNNRADTLRVYYKHAMGVAGETSFAALSAPEGYYFEHSESEMRKNDGSEAIPVPVVTVSDPSSLNQQTACWWTSDGGDGRTYHVESGVDRSEWTLYLIEEYTKTDVWATAHVV